MRWRGLATVEPSAAAGCADLTQAGGLAALDVVLRCLNVYFAPMDAAQVATITDASVAREKKRNPLTHNNFGDVRMPERSLRQSRPTRCKHRLTALCRIHAMTPMPLHSAKHRVRKALHVNAHPRIESLRKCMDAKY